MNKPAVFIFILLSLGIFLWMQRDTVSEITPIGGGSAGSASGQTNEKCIIRQKIKPGGYIGWHRSEKDEFTHRAVQTRQASNYYFVCTGLESGTERIFLVPQKAFHMERVGNVLPPHLLGRFEEVTTLEEPDLPPNYNFRR